MVEELTPEKWVPLMVYQPSTETLLCVTSYLVECTGSNGPWVVGTMRCTLCNQSLVTISELKPWLEHKTVICDNCEVGEVELREVE